MGTRVSTWSAVAAGAVAGLVVAFTVTGSSGQGTRAARTVDGRPNLNGIWQVMNTANWDLLAHTVRPAVTQQGV